MIGIARADTYIKTVLAAIAILLGVLALRPAVVPPIAHAESDYSYFFIEPGTTTIRTPDGLGQVQGKVVIDRRNGDVWGFPTGSTVPYPVVATSSQPPWSKPIYLGRFDFSAMKRVP